MAQGIIDQSKDFLVDKFESQISLNQHSKDNILEEKDNNSKVASKNVNSSNSTFKFAFCSGMLSLLTDKLRTIEAKIDKLLIKDLKSAISNLNKAANALEMPSGPNVKLFTDYIIIANNKATDAIQVVPNLNNKLNGYCIRIITEYLIFSDFGNNILDGIFQIYNIVNEMNHNKELINDINKILGSKMYWTTTEKYNLKLLRIFAIQIEELISTLTKNVGKYKIRK